MSYNPNIHHRRSIRLKGYDYAQAGLYFITICVQDKAHLFGTIKNGEMLLNQYGTIAHNEWINTILIRPNVELGVFIIMPNHMHGIIKINEIPNGELIIRTGESHSPLNNNELHSPLNNKLLHLKSDKTHLSIITGECDSPPTMADNTNTTITGETNSTVLRGPSNTVGAIVRGYKSSVTKQLNLLNVGRTVWQPNYYENIIRDERAYNNITAYIINNPKKWDADKFYS